MSLLFRGSVFLGIGNNFWWKGLWIVRIVCVLTLFCVVMTCCSCDCHYGRVCYAGGV